MDKLLTIQEAAKLLNITAETLRRWDKSGKFISRRHPVNNYRMYRLEDVTSLVEEMQMEIGYSDFKIKNEKHYHSLYSNKCFETELGRLYQMDALAMLRSLESNSVDLVFSDPPYNIKKAQWDTFSSQKEYVEWCMHWIEESHRVLKPTGSLYICGFSEILADIKWAASHKFKGCKWLVWFYRNKANLGNDWGRSHESILHFRMSKKFTFNIDEVRIPYNAHTLKYPKRTQADSSQYANGKKYTWQPNPKGAKPKDVIEIPTLSNGSWERFDHETQKPVELLRKIILSSSNKGDLVVDPFGGSGTTFAVSEAYDRKWIGSELEGKYCQTIKDRLENEEHINMIKNEHDLQESIRRRKKLRG